MVCGRGQNRLMRRARERGRICGAQTGESGGWHCVQLKLGFSIKESLCFDGVSKTGT